MLAVIFVGFSLGSAFAQTPIDDFLNAAKAGKIADTDFEAIEAVKHEDFQDHNKHNDVMHVLRDRATGKVEVEDSIRLRCYTALARLGEPQNEIVTQVLALAATTPARNSLGPIAATLEDASYARREARHKHTVGHDDVFLEILRVIERLDAQGVERPIELLSQLSQPPFFGDFERFLARNPTSKGEIHELLRRAISDVDRDRSKLRGEARAANRRTANSIRDSAKNLNLELPTAPPETPEPVVEKEAAPLPALPPKQQQPRKTAKAVKPAPPAKAATDPSRTTVPSFALAAALIQAPDMPHALREDVERKLRTFLRRAASGTRANLIRACNLMLTGNPSTPPS